MSTQPHDNATIESISLAGRHNSDTRTNKPLNRDDWGLSKMSRGTERLDRETAIPTGGGGIGGGTCL